MNEKLTWIGSAFYCTALRYKLNQQNIKIKTTSKYQKCFHKDWFGLGTGGLVWKHTCKSGSVHQQRTNSRSYL